jgi:hypothetical protein
MGLAQTSLRCTRTNGKISSNDCFLCPSDIQIYDFCTYYSCPSGFEVVNTLTDTFLGTQVCLRVPEVNSINKFYNIYVNTTGKSNGNGTLNDPTTRFFKHLLWLQENTQKFEFPQGLIIINQKLLQTILWLQIQPLH